MKNIKIYQEFWDALEEHRNSSYYNSLREKMNIFLKRKQVENGPASGRDKPFGSKMNELKGVWHFAISRNPDIVIFYTMDNENINVLMLGNHHDYPSDGKNHSARSRIGKRIMTTLEKNNFGSPEWKKFSWDTLEDIIGNIEIPELSKYSMDEVLREIAMEFKTGEKFFKENGCDLLDCDENVFNDYLENLEKAKNEILLVRDSRLKEQYYFKNNIVNKNTLN